jgi:N-succinyldiaminopimelate aminotransferase
MNPAVQEASVAAWNDEHHVRENRRKYAEKFARVTPIMQTALEVERPDAGFYLWARTPIEDTEFGRRLYAEQHLTVLPGSFLARDSGGTNPGAGYVRMALVAEIDECLEAARRIVEFATKL